MEETKRIIGLSKQITELGELHKKLVASDVKLHNYIAVNISDSLQDAIDNYRGVLYKNK